jgi:hypothetical protein
MGADEPSDKPFDDEPFDAGVEADEDSDPKKYIEQLTGKLGQSLRKYNESQGQPDYELEKFAINSLLSASHTSEMDENDQADIIKKVKTAGNNDDNQDDNQDDSADDNAGGSDGDTSGDDFGGDMGDGQDDGGQDMGGVNEEKETPLFLDKPKKNNMFQPGSNDILKENQFDFVKSAIESASGDKVQQREVDDENQPLYWSLTNKYVNYYIGDGEQIIQYNAQTGERYPIGELKHYNEPRKIKEGLIESKKSSIFDKIKSKLQETFNQEDMAEPTTEPAVKPAPVKTPKTTPIAPSRKNKPFLPMPEVQPDPKASK